MHGSLTQRWRSISGRSYQQVVLTGQFIFHAFRLLTSQKFLKAQRDVPIPVVVVLFEDIGHPL